MITLEMLDRTHQAYLANQAKEAAAQEDTVAVRQACDDRQAHQRPSCDDEALYVATDCTYWRTDRPTGLAGDLGVNGTCYRRLDPIYFAWLWQQMEKVQWAHHTGKMPQALFDQVSQRFQEIYAWALVTFDEDSIDKARKAFALRARLYKPPSMEPLIRLGFEPAPEDRDRAEEDRRKQAYLFPEKAADDSWSFWTPVAESAREKVAAIQAKALAKGWTEGSLWQNRGTFKFPFGDGYGLICFVKDADQIGQVRADHIEIIKPAPANSILRFQKPKD
ncbi:hypothetical protein SCOR_15275 [Sulfidibacter corallicola]|uniref:Uncharacterized protein n=1 Tax=Sulfidibacter corallicola TaxID=2818388 RepID=A0A8A4TXF5_SULCO|nr:hypothetical protein [Sulfidibacter corallicola]QTD54170.1 hypothetical protein J3U87_17125 [Sulfidibacter corallicola]